ncbi:MAG: STAS domain-containing protein [Chloroflexota bacterium]
MTLILATILVLLVEAILVTFVALRSHNPQAAWLFAIGTVFRMGIHIVVLLQSQAPDIQTVYNLRLFVPLFLAGFAIALLLLLSILFMPKWFQGRRPIYWILLPYVVVTSVLAFDLFSQSGLIVDGLRQVGESYSLNTVSPGIIIIRVLFLGSWFVHLALLGIAFGQNAHLRLPISFIFIALVVSLISGPFVNRIPMVAPLVQDLPIQLALAFTVLRTPLFVPTQAALDTALKALSEAIVVLDRTHKVTYANPKAMALGFQETQHLDALTNQPEHNRSLIDLIQQATQHEASSVTTLDLQNRRMVFTISAITDAQERYQGNLLLGRDVTELEERTQSLEDERIHLAETIQKLEAEQLERQQLSATVRTVSFPIIPVFDGVIVLPLIGTFDRSRIDDFPRSLLQGIKRQRARLILLDFTGMPLVDQDVAATILSGVQAASLLGARCLFVGIRPEIADALISSNTPLGQMKSFATLQEGIQYTLHRNGRK